MLCRDATVNHAVLLVGYGHDATEVSAAAFGCVDVCRQCLRHFRKLAFARSGQHGLLVGFLAVLLCLLLVSSSFWKLHEVVKC